MFRKFEKKKKLKEQIRIISESGYLDKDWYLKNNPDVYALGMDPTEHYLKYGWKEGRNPGPKFNTNEYLDIHPECKICPLLFEYSITTPHSELLRHSPYFDAKWYLEKYHDIKNMNVDAITHYLLYGWKEGKNPSSKFDASFYLEANQDVREANINPLIHFIQYGQYENRKAKLSVWETFLRIFHIQRCNEVSDYQLIKHSKFFDRQYYLKQCHKLNETITDPIDHYLNIGWKEGLNPSNKFDTNYYLEINADVKDAGINPLLHYEMYGKSENRKVSMSLDDKIILQMKEYLNTQKCDVLLFSHELSITGAPLVLFNIAKILKAKKYDPIIISPSHGKLEKMLKSEQIKYYVCPGIENTNISELKSCFSKFDFAICNTYLLAGLALKLQNILPALLYIHEGPEGLFDLNSGQARIISGIKITKLLSQVENIVCVSPYARSFYTPYVNHKIGILKNYIDDACISPQYNKKKIKFCYVGTITQQRKNVGTLLRSYQQLHEQNMQTELHMIGDTNTSEAKRYIKQYPYVFWHGTLTGTKKQKVMNECDVIIIPSSTESCSLVALEAASLSKPVILTQTVGAKYMFKDGENAIFCEPNDEKSLMECMVEMAKNMHLIKKMGEKAYKAYKKNATKEVFERELLNVIKETKQNFNNSPDINDLTIIVPIYNAAEKTDKCIQSIIRNTPLSKQVQLLLIDDCSPDQEVKKVLSKYKNTRFINIVKNPENLGYTKNINKAIKLAQKSDVILLNSDTIVTKNWIKKLQKAAYLSSGIGTVTPVSNSAGAFSVPNYGTNIIPPHLTIEKMAKIVSQEGKDKYFDVPTGNGFCFFIKRCVIDTIGLFDEEKFPKGYGEENDYSMRAKLNGFLNIVTLDTYIFHHEHASFKEASRILMEKSNQIINSLYSNYHQEINVFRDNPTFNTLKNNIQEKMEIKNEIL